MFLQQCIMYKLRKILKVFGLQKNLNYNIYLHIIHILHPHNIFTQIYTSNIL